MMDQQSIYGTGQHEFLCGQQTFREEIVMHYQYTKIVKDWTGHLHYISYAITKNKQVTEDIVQEAFLELWQHRVKIIAENPVGWLLQVVTNLSRKHIRKTILHTRLNHSWHQEKKVFYSDVEERLIGKEKYKLLNTVFNKLPSQQKIVLYLSKEEGLDRQEIAARLKLSPNTVKVHLLRAMQFMKEQVTCMILFILFLLCQNIFFKSSNTIERFRELFKVQQVTDEYLPETNKNVLLLSTAGTLHTISQAVTVSLNR